MNLYVQGCLQPCLQHACNMPWPLRGRLKHGARSAFVCERQLPLSKRGLIKFWGSMTVGRDQGRTRGLPRMVREDYFIWIRDNSGLVEASQLWNSSCSSWYPPDHAWKIIGYDLQKWKVIGNNVHRTTCHPIPPLCKMISEICYSFPFVRYKYCLFADIDISLFINREYNRSGLFRFSTSDVAEQSIVVRRDLNAYDEMLMQF